MSADHISIQKFRWLGSENRYLDHPTVHSCGEMSIGRFGGHTAAGADKNEDGALAWCAANGSWKFAVLLDAHSTSQSAALVLDSIESVEKPILDLLDLPGEKWASSLDAFFPDLFQSADFRKKCREVKGETACLICVQKGKFLWWFSVGDCLVYLFHPELAKLGQYALNQRSFYEWIGRVNTFDLPVPCFASGTRELRQGENLILMLTDGVLECGKRPFENSAFLYEAITKKNEQDKIELVANMLQVLNRVDSEKGRDSATMIAWSYDHKEADCAYPSS